MDALKLTMRTYLDYCRTKRSKPDFFVLSDPPHKYVLSWSENYMSRKKSTHTCDVTVC